MYLDWLICHINLIFSLCFSLLSLRTVQDYQMWSFGHSSAASLIISHSGVKNTNGSHISKVIGTNQQEFHLTLLINFSSLSQHKKKSFLDDAECELNCRPVNQKYFARLKEYTVDGTHCTKVLNPPKNNVSYEQSVCVEGKCRVS